MLKEILKAKKTIKGKINRTPLVLAKNISRKIKCGVYFKPEVFQKTSSFKIRGILNRIQHLTLNEKRDGLITISAGSHALSLSFVSSALNIPLTVVMPKNIPSNKVNLIKSYGSEIVLTDNPISECRKIQKKNNLTMIHPFNDPLIIAGQGTIGLEIMEELPDVDMVFVPIGGGGLISGIAIAIKLQKPKVKIVGVEPVGAPTMFESIRNNKISYLNRRKTVADCLNAPCVGKHTFNYSKKYVDDFILVSDQEIKKALREIWKDSRIKIEPSGAVASAGIIFEKVKIPQGSKVVSVLTGGNIEENNFKKIINEI